MRTYSYSDCLDKPYRVNWRLSEVLEGREFDPNVAWLPSALSGGSRVSCLSDEEKRKLSHVEMGSYAHLFGYVEEFIAPKVTDLAKESFTRDREAYDALTNFAAEEIKHMTLFRALRRRVNEALGLELELIGKERETARYVLSKNSLAVLLLTACIEWFTQRHYLEAFECDQTVDPFTKHVFKCHWMEEAQHAKMDHMEALRIYEGMNPEEREQAIADLIELVGSVDGLLRKQAAMDLRSYLEVLDRPMNERDREEVHAGILGAKRYTFLASGLTHDRFAELFDHVTTAQQKGRVASALQGLL